MMYLCDHTAIRKTSNTGMSAVHAVGWENVSQERNDAPTSNFIEDITCIDSGIVFRFSEKPFRLVYM